VSGQWRIVAAAVAVVTLWRSGQRHSIVGQL